MDLVLNVLCDFGFRRLTSQIGCQIVVHCVPGAGKSTCIRAILNADNRFRAFTLGRADQPSLTGRVINAFEGVTDPKFINILDEYNLREVDLSSFQVIFGDPFQSKTPPSIYATHICDFSKRFGRCTAQLLRDLGFEVQATGDDLVIIRDIYEVDPAHTTIYYEPEIGRLLCNHNLEASHISSLAGASFDHVTFVTSRSQLPFEERADAYRCLTRHRLSLLILCPDATYTSA